MITWKDFYSSLGLMTGERGWVDMTGEEDSTGDIQLGGNITLSGFREVEPAKMIVVKKIVGNYIKRVQDRNVGFEKVSLTMKNVHSSECEIKCSLHLNGKVYYSNHTGFNLFIVLDKSLNGVMAEARIG